MGFLRFGLTRLAPTDPLYSKLAFQGMSLVGSRGALLVSTVFVARSAGIHEYGTLAVALILFQGGLFLRDAGLGQALIVLGGARPGDAWTVFVLTSAIGFVVSTGMLVGADASSHLLGIPEAAEAIRILALAFGLGSLGIASNASLERKLRFRSRAAIDLLSYGALLIVTLVGLTRGMGASALAWGYVAQGVIQSLLGLISAPPWAERYAAGNYGPILRYGGLLWVGAALSFLAANLDNALVGRLGGAEVLGIYALSYSIGCTLTISLAQVVGRVTLPYVAQRAHDLDQTSHRIRRLMPAGVAAAAAPALVIVCFAPELASLAFGDRTIVAPLVILSCYGVVRSAGVIVGSALNGIQQAGQLIASGALNVGLLVAMIVPGYTLGGVAGVAVAVLLAMLAAAAYALVRLSRRTDIPYRFLMLMAGLLSIAACAVVVSSDPPLLMRVVLLVCLETILAWGLLVVLRPTGSRSC